MLVNQGTRFVTLRTSSLSVTRAEYPNNLDVELEMGFRTKLDNIQVMLNSMSAADRAYAVGYITSTAIEETCHG